MERPLQLPLMPTLVTAVAFPESQAPFTTQQKLVLHWPGCLGRPQPCTEPELNWTVGPVWHTGGGLPQTLGICVPPQVWPPEQVPQSRVPPQPSEAEPQSKPS